MYGPNTTSLPVEVHSIEDGFHQLLKKAARTIRDRMESYDPQTDPLKRSHLRILSDIVTIEADRAAAGTLSLYSGLEPPIRAVADWGEPADSPLTVSLRDAETFFRRNHGPEHIAAQTIH